MKYIISLIAIASTMGGCASAPPSRPLQPNQSIDHEENLRFCIERAIRNQECQDNPFLPMCGSNTATSTTR